MTKRSESKEKESGLQNENSRGQQTGTIPKPTSTASEILETFESAKLTDLLEAWTKFKQKYNITDTVPGSVATASSESGDDESAPSVKMVSLKFIGWKEGFEEGAGRIKAYKKIMNVSEKTGKKIGIIDAKKLVDNAEVLIEGIVLSEAQEIKKDLENNGLLIEIA